jgi:Tol biopolymer transport system component
MRNMIKLCLCTVSLGLILVGCQQQPNIKFKAIKVCTFQEFDPDSPNSKYAIVLYDEELAEIDTFDTGSSSNIPPTQHVTIADDSRCFHHYGLHGKDKVVYSVENGNNNSGFDLWVSNGRTGKIRLTNTKLVHKYPSFSSDGKHVYFISRRGRSFDNSSSYMWRMAANGSGGLTRIGNGVYSHTQAVQESPNGQYILYASKERYGGSSTIWFARKNGSTPTQLTVGTSAVWMDDNTIMYEASDTSNSLSSIWKMKLDGSEKTLIISERKSDVIQVIPSPDRKKLAYVTQARNKRSNRKDTSSRDIWVMDLTTGSPTQITTNLSQDAMPQWSSNGDSLYFASSRGVNWNIWKMNIASMFGKGTNSYSNESYQRNNSYNSNSNQNNNQNSNSRSEQRSNDSEDDSPWEPGAFEVDDGF